MNSSLSQSAMRRLLVLSDRAYDLDIQLRNMHLPSGREAQRELMEFTTGPIADLQDEIDQTVRAGLVTCWLEDSTQPED